jgi:serine/threonine protein kinase/Tol biopolymer transport system component
VIQQGRWKEVSRLYHAALERSADDRRAFLEQACAGDEALQGEIESLLGSDAAAGDFMELPVGGVMAGALEADLVSLVGRQLASYRIDALLGTGGMGEVYRATDTRLNRAVALKILPHHLREVPDLRDRFEREARAVAMLRHPHICVLHDIGEDDGIAFLVMELLDGETLARRLTRGPLGRDELFRTSIEIADALVETHRHGVVHGDLKPGNIMLTGDGAKLLDFGLATLGPVAASEVVTGAAEPASSARAAGGTLPYMAPEQLEGRATDHRIDIFAFGAILYEMIFGRKAFDRPDAPAPRPTVVAYSPPPFEAGAPAWAKELEPFIARCLARQPEERWTPTFDMADELRRISIGSDEATSGSIGRARARAWWGVAAAAATLVIALWWVADGWSLPGASAVADRSRVALTLGNMRRVTSDDQLEIDPAFSPDGRFVAYAAGSATGMRIFVRPVGEGVARPLTGDADALEFHPRWSPDGTEILYVTPGGAFVAGISGGTARRVDSPTDTAGSYSATTSTTARRIFSSAIWSPDGRHIAIAYGGSLTIVPADGVGNRRRIANSPYELHSCDWSPDGRWIACVSGNWSFPGPEGYFGNISPSALLLIPAAEGPVVELMTRTAVHRSPVWSKDGRRLYFVSNRQGPSDIYSMDVTEAGAVRGDPIRVTTGLGVYSIAFSSNGRQLAYAAYSSRSNIWSVRLPSNGTVTLSSGRAVTSGNQTIEAMRVTRDARWLLYDSNLHGNFDIFRLALSDGHTERLTADPDDEFAPDLSADGQSLAYHSWRTMSRDIFVKRQDSPRLDQVTATPSQESFPAWSPDGRSIAFLDQFVENGVARGAFLIRSNSGGGWGAPVLLRAGTSRVSWSPDGRFLAYALRGTVEVLPIDSRVPWTVYAPATPGVDPAARSVQVGPEGRTLYFKSHDDRGRASFWSIPATGGKPRLLITLDDPARPSSRSEFAVDRQRLYFAIEDRRSNIWVTDVTER